MALNNLLTNYPGGYEQGREILDLLVRKARFIDTTVIPKGAVGLVSGDRYTIFNIPAGALLSGTYVVTSTAEGAADTIDITDTAAGVTYINDVSLNTTATATAGANLPHFYGSASTIEILANAAITAAKFWVVIEYQVLKVTF